MASDGRIDAPAWGEVGSPSANEPWVDDVLAFWFREHGQADWFRVSPELDTEIRSRFAGPTEKIAGLSFPELTANAQTAFAAVIALDQFPRNIHRDRKEAFDTDAKARAVAEVAVARGFDAGLSKDERLFLYLPFEHSEDLDDQRKSVGLIGALDDPKYLDYAERHLAVIERFGRFPHCNAALGRETTPEEAAFLKTVKQCF